MIFSFMTILLRLDIHIQRANKKTVVTGNNNASVINKKTVATGNNNASVIFSRNGSTNHWPKKKKKGKFQLTQNWGGKKYFTGHRCGHYFH